jgi:3-mercaptopyruvate sulfurtransferase SseA
MKSDSKSLWLALLFKDLKSAFLLICISFFLGVLVNQVRDKPLAWRYQSKKERLQKQITKLAGSNPEKSSVQAGHQNSLSLDEFRKVVASKQSLILDARPEIFYRLGHVPGALSLPREDFEKAYARLRASLERNGKNAGIVVYCSDISCEDSKLVQEALLRLGYSDVKLFAGGWEEWTGERLPEEK